MNIQFNGAEGPSAGLLMQNNFDPGILRPYYSDPTYKDPFTGKYGNGRSYVALKDGFTTNEQGQQVPKYKSMVTNATATLRKDEWIQFDQAVIREVKNRLRLWDDLTQMTTPYNIPNGMGKTVLEWESQSDITGAETNMDGLTRTEGDRPIYELHSLPLPITHKDFGFTARQVMTSRNAGNPLDTTTAELAARKVAEKIEQMVAGATADDYTYAGGTVEGYRTATNANTVTITAPTAGGWTPTTLLQEILEMRNDAQSDFHYGPYKCYNSPDWDQYMDEDYSAAKGSNTMRDRIGAVDDIDRPVRADYLTGWEILLIQKTPDVARAVTAMPITTVQWETHGGMMLHFKVMGIMVPQVRSTQGDKSGIVYGS